MFRDSELYRHAERELDRLVEDERKSNMVRSIGDLEEDVKTFNGMTPQEFVREEVLNIISVIDPKKHRVETISAVLEIAGRLVKLENLLPLTLDDNEFEEVARVSLEDGTEDVVYQNTRNIKVYKSTQKGVYHLDGLASLEIATGRFNIESGVDKSVNEQQLSIFDFMEE